MFVSSRFRDIFSTGPIRTRRDDHRDPAESEPVSADGDRASDAEAIWLEITAAHRRAARAFTLTKNRAADLAGES